MATVLLGCTLSAVFITACVLVLKTFLGLTKAEKRKDEKSLSILQDVL